MEAWIDFVIGGKERKNKQRRLGLEDKTKMITIMGWMQQFKFSRVLRVQVKMNGRVHTWTPTPTLLWLLTTKFSAEARRSSCRLLQDAWVT